jgi:hypothetical protein
MVLGQLTRLRRFVEALFPERHLYLRSNGVVHGMVLTTSRQVAASQPSIPASTSPARS